MSSRIPSAAYHSRQTGIDFDRAFPPACSQKYVYPGGRRSGVRRYICADGYCQTVGCWGHCLAAKKARKLIHGYVQRHALTSADLLPPSAEWPDPPPPQATIRNQATIHLPMGTGNAGIDPEGSLIRYLSLERRRPHESEPSAPCERMPISGTVGVNPE
jgi:hypothetical protein